MFNPAIRDTCDEQWKDFVAQTVGHFKKCFAEETAEEAVMKIDNATNGDIAGRDITVLESGAIQGDVSAKTLHIYGAIRGTIKAASIAVHSTARIDGELHYETLTIAPGARINARCEPAALV
jgi:cytoskeletal protein CcmA (bactofilin family)